MVPKGLFGLVSKTNRGVNPFCSSDTQVQSDELLDGEGNGNALSNKLQTYRLGLHKGHVEFSFGRS